MNCKTECSNCTHFQKSDEPNERLNGLGICRLNPPQLFPVQHQHGIGFMSVPLKVNGKDYCSHHKVVLTS